MRRPLIITGTWEEGSFSPRVAETPRPLVQPVIFIGGRIFNQGKKRTEFRITPTQPRHMPSRQEGFYEGASHTSATLYPIELGWYSLPLCGKAKGSFAECPCRLTCAGSVMCKHTNQESWFDAQTGNPSLKQTFIITTYRRLGSYLLTKWSTYARTSKFLPPSEARIPALLKSARLTSWVYDSQNPQQWGCQSFWLGILRVGGSAIWYFFFLDQTQRDVLWSTHD